MAEVIKHEPPPVELTYDIIGLTQDEAELIACLVGMTHGKSSAVGYRVWCALYERVWGAAWTTAHDRAKKRFGLTHLP